MSSPLKRKTNSNVNELVKKKKSTASKKIIAEDTDGDDDMVSIPENSVRLEIEEVKEHSKAKKPKQIEEREETKQTSASPSVSVLEEAELDKQLTVLASSSDKQLISASTSGIIAGVVKNQYQPLDMVTKLYNHLGCYGADILTLSKSKANIRLIKTDNTNKETNGTVPHYVQVKGGIGNAGKVSLSNSTKSLHDIWVSLPPMTGSMLLFPPFGTLNSPAFAPKKGEYKRTNYSLYLRPISYNGINDPLTDLVMGYLKNEVVNPILQAVLDDDVIGRKSNTVTKQKDHLEFKDNLWYNDKLSLTMTKMMTREPKSDADFKILKSKDQEFKKYARNKYLGDNLIRSIGAPENARLYVDDSEEGQWLFRVCKYTKEAREDLKIKFPNSPEDIPEYYIKPCTWQEAESISHLEDNNFLSTIHIGAGFGGTGGTNFGLRCTDFMLIWLGTNENTVVKNRGIPKTEIEWLEIASKQEIKIRLTDDEYWKLLKNEDQKKIDGDQVKARMAEYVKLVRENVIKASTI